MKSELVKSMHLARRAVVYIRQSTPHQVVTNQESLRLQYALRQRAIELGWHEADIDIIEMGIDATQRAILTGAVEGGNIREPALTIAQRQNPNIKLVATGADMFPNFPGVVVAVSGSFADKNPKAVEDLVRLVIRATKLLEADPARAAPYVGVGLGKGLVPNDVILAALKSPQTRFTSDPRSIIESTAKLQDYQVKLGALQKALPLDGLFAVSVYERAAGN